jgi:sigma-54 dependent transcriptional regulator, acetoin dehydrogenase operon transcriptional activator AcoR
MSMSPPLKRVERRALDLPVVLAGSSDAVTASRAALARAVDLAHPILLEAEPGCRPVDIAAALHAGSRPDAPFVDVRVDAPGEPGAMHRLFGSPGSPGDADLEHLGAGAALVEAGAGTVFIDGLDDLPAAVQRRLARVLRDGEVTVEGVQGAVALACRLIASTAGAVEERTADGRLRGDLLRRFQHAVVPIPPLRQRPGDFAAILEQLLEDLGHGDRRFTQAAVTVLAAVPWTRNVDELADTVAGILATAGPVVQQEDILARLPMENAFARFDTSTSLREARRRFEREYIAAVLERHHWRMSEAARVLGIERANLYRKARQLGISRASRVEAP